MCLGTIKGKGDEFRLLKGVPFFVFIAMMLTSSAIESKKKKVYPVNESFRVNEKTGECLFRGKNKNYYGVRSHCYYAYGNMTGDNYNIPLFYQLMNWTGCMIFARLDKLERIPLGSVMSLRANTDFCQLKYGLLVYGNENLYRIGLRKNMDIKKEEVFIRANPKLQRDQVINAPFEVDVGDPHDCTMEMALKRKDCTGLVGDVIYPGDAYMRDVWIGVSRVYGTITVDEIWEYDLGMLKKLTVDGWLPRVVRIVNNHKLRHIDELLKIKVTGPEPLFWFHNNTSFCHTVDIRSKIEAKVKTKLSWDERCLERCAGGVVDAQYLKNFHRFCNIIDGDLIIEGLKEVPEHFEKLAQIEKLYGHLVVKGNAGIPDLSFLPYLREIRLSNKKHSALEVHDNQNFVVKGLDAIKVIDGDAKIITDEDTDTPAAFRKHITDVTTGITSFSSRKCKGGQIGSKYLDKIGDSCREIIGDLMIRELTATPKEIARLAGIVRIHGRLVVKDNTAVKDLSFLAALQEISNPKSEEPSLEIADNLNFALIGLTSIKKIHGNVYILTEKESDVPSKVKQHITSITDGTATFLVRQKTAGEAKTTEQGTTPSETLTSITNVHSRTVKVVERTGKNRTSLPKSEQKKVGKSEHHGSAKSGGISAIWIVVILAVIFVLLALAVLGVIFASKHMKKQQNVKPVDKETTMSRE